MSRLRPYAGVYITRRGVRPYAGLRLRLNPPERRQVQRAPAVQMTRGWKVAAAIVWTAAILLLIAVL